MPKQTSSPNTEKHTRNFDIPPNEWDPFDSYVQSLETRQGDKIKDHIYQYEVARAAFKLIQCFGVDLGRRFVRKYLEDDAFWSELRISLKPVIVQLLLREQDLEQNE
jgi:hypothetical protein